MESVDTPDSSRSGFASKLTISAGRLALCAAVAAVLVSCPKPTPDTPGAPSGPGSCWQGIPAEFKVSTTIRGSSSMQFVLDWGDGDTQTAPSDFGSGETCAVSHTWDTPGEYAVRVMAHHAGWPEIASSWSPALTVTVLAQGAPTIDSALVPGYAARGVAVQFQFIARDPDGDYTRLRVDWGDGSESVSRWATTSPCTLGARHAFGSADTFLCSAQVEDYKGGRSAARQFSVVVDRAGAVVMSWRGSRYYEFLTTSALVAEGGVREYLYGGCEDYSPFYRVGLDGSGATTANARFDGHFETHPSMCPVTRDVVSASQEGMLYAWDPGMGDERCWPDWHHRESLYTCVWTPAAWNGTRFYAARHYDSVFCLEVTAGAINRIGACYVGDAIAGAPVIDATGNVYLGTVSGYLYKLTAGLELAWRVSLPFGYEGRGLALGQDGTVFAVDDGGMLHAVNGENGQTRWSRQVDTDIGPAAVGSGVLFVGGSGGRFYALNTTDGSTRWQAQLGTDYLTTTPILTYRGLLYAVNWRAVVYCVQMANGRVVWSCDCDPDTLGTRAVGRTGLSQFAPDPGITSTGDIVVVARHNAYLVSGYPDALLDTLQPWPKWQHDRYNSGKQQQ